MPPNYLKKFGTYFNGMSYALNLSSMGMLHRFQNPSHHGEMLMMFFLGYYAIGVSIWFCEYLDQHLHRYRNGWSQFPFPEGHVASDGLTSSWGCMVGRTANFVIGLVPPTSAKHSTLLSEGGVFLDKNDPHEKIWFHTWEDHSKWCSPA